MPTGGVPVCCGGGTASGLPAGKSWVVVCNPIAFGVLRPRMAFILTKDIFIIPRAFQEQLIIRRLAERTRQLCRAPIVITLRLGDRDGLAPFPRMNSSNRFLFSGTKSGHVAMFVQKIIQGTFR